MLSNAEIEQITGILAQASAREGRPVLTADLVRDVGRVASLASEEQQGEYWNAHPNMTVIDAYNHGVYCMGEALIRAGQLEDTEAEGDAE